MSDANQFFINKGGEAVGPFSAAQLRAKLAAGDLRPETLFAREGSEDWRPLSDLLPGVSGAPLVSLAEAADTTVGVVPWLMLVGGGLMAVYFGLAFDPSRAGINNLGLLNDRLCGVIFGCTMMVVAALFLVLQALWRIVAELKNRK